jgi:hypothetical protein
MVIVINYFFSKQTFQFISILVLWNVFGTKGHPSQILGLVHPRDGAKTDCHKIDYFERLSPRKLNACSYRQRSFYQIITFMIFRVEILTLGLNKLGPKILYTSKGR